VTKGSSIRAINSCERAKKLRVGRLLARERLDFLRGRATNRHEGANKLGERRTDVHERRSLRNEGRSLGRTRAMRPRDLRLLA
jgi:hypothetical protein